MKNLKLRGRRKGGTPITVLLSVSVLEEGGNEKLIIGAVKDITEQTNAEEALRDSEEKYRVLYESSRDALMRDRGRLYDPRVCDACWSLFKEKGFTLAPVK